MDTVECIIVYNGEGGPGTAKALVLNRNSQTYAIYTAVEQYTCLAACRAAVSPSQRWWRAEHRENVQFY